jgi:DNA repair exonuclease SbcCD ATPase subunit
MVRYVLHIADVHIRSGAVGKSRRLEYERVIENLVSFARGLDDEVVTVVAGDILHDRSNLDPHAVHVFRKLLVSLSEVGWVVLIQGNHDHHPMHDDPETPHDVISALVELAGLSRVRYLSKSGYYKLENLGFGVVTVHDSVPAGEARSGREEIVCPYPEPDSGLFNMALFHGMIEGCRSVVEGRGVSIKVFGGYDAIALGDQHLQQIGNHVVGADGQLLLSSDKTKPTWAYPGSLIQQGHGESLWNHGAILWDVTMKTLTPVHIRNPFGYITLQDDNMFYDGSWQLLSRHADDPDFPTTVHARIKGGADGALEALRRRGVSVINASKHMPVPLSSKSTQSVSSHERDWRTALGEMGVDLSVVLESAYLPSFKEKVLRDTVKSRNAKLDRITKTVRESGAPTRTAMRPLRLRWDWMMCFGRGNDVGILSEDGVVLVSAPNGAGKSAFLEVLMYALFGEGIPTRCMRDNSASLINVDMPEDQVAMAEVDFEQGGVEYRITRKWSASSKDNTKAVCKCAEVVRTQDSKVLFKGRVAVDDWVQSNVCSASDFMAGPMLSQGGDGDVLSLNPKDMSALLERAFGLAGIDALGELISEGINAHKQVQVRVDALCHGVDKGAYEEIEASYIAASERSARLQERLYAMPTVNCPSTVDLERASLISTDSKYEGLSYSKEAHARDEERLQCLKECSIPASSPFPDEPQPRKSEDLATVSKLWSAYESVSELHRSRGYDHACLRREEGLMSRIHDPPKDMKLIQREFEVAASRVERLKRELLSLSSACEAASAALKSAGEYQEDAVMHKLKSDLEAYRLEWGSSSAEARPRILFDYILSPASSVLPRSKALSESCTFSDQSMFATPDMTECLKRLGGGDYVETERGRPPCTVQEASDELHRVQRALSAAQIALVEANYKRDIAKEELDSVDAELVRKLGVLSELERAWSPLCGIDFEAHSSLLSKSTRDLENKIRVHRQAKKRGVADTVLSDHVKYTERERVKEELRAVGLEAASLEWGRVRGAKAMLDDLENAAESRRRLDTLLDALSKLRSAKAWLYKEMVAPDIQRRVNEVVQRIEPSLSTVCVVNDDGGVSWSVEDRGRQVAPNKASGFQRFLISVAIRVVIGGMIAPCTLQVIDEGFTACDEMHLQRVPTFLDWLVQQGGIRTVLLVSHLSELKSYVEKRVDINVGRPFVA